jgi:hypothetical protein
MDCDFCDRLFRPNAAGSTRELPESGAYSIPTILMILTRGYSWDTRARGMRPLQGRTTGRLVAGLAWPGERRVRAQERIQHPAAESARTASPHNKNLGCVGHQDVQTLVRTSGHSCCSANSPVMLPDVSEKISYDCIFPPSSRHKSGFQTRPHLPHSARLRRSAGLAAGHRGCGLAYAREGVGAG